MKTRKCNLLIYLFFFYGFIVSSCTKDDEQPQKKTGDYFYHSNHSYLIVKELKTWAQAAADATLKGGYLVEINNESEQKAIWEEILKLNTLHNYLEVPDGGNIAYIWIGATDRKKEGDWLWNGKNSDNGTLFWRGEGNNGEIINQSYVNWGGEISRKMNEPDNFTYPDISPNGQNAAAIGLAKWPAADNMELGKAGEWNDINELNKLYYIIEFDTVKK